MKDVVIDACCLINLLAAEVVLSKFQRQKTKSKEASSGNVNNSTGAVLHVPQIIATESMYLLQPDLDDPSKLFKSPINLDPYFSAGTLDHCDVKKNRGNRTFYQVRNEARRWRSRMSCDRQESRVVTCDG